LCFFSFFLGFLLFFSTTGTSSFSGDFEVSTFLCFWMGSFSLSAKGLGRGGENQKSLGRTVACPHGWLTLCIKAPAPYAWPKVCVRL
jgi:hypothetical protein